MRFATARGPSRVVQAIVRKSDRGTCSLCRAGDLSLGAGTIEAESAHFSLKTGRLQSFSSILPIDYIRDHSYRCVGWIFEAMGTVQALATFGTPFYLFVRFCFIELISTSWISTLARLF